MTSDTFLGTKRAEAASESFRFLEYKNAGAGKGVQRHSHDDAHLVLVLSGRYFTEAVDGGAMCGPSTLIFNPRGTRHRDRFIGDEGAFLAICMSRAIADRIESVQTRATTLNGAAAIRAAHGAARELRERGPFSDLMLEGLGLEVAAAAARVAEYPAAPAWLHRGREMLHETRAQGAQIGTIARELGVHASHFAKAFRRFFGCTPGEYVRQCRLEDARHLIARSNLPLAIVAQMSGYCDQSRLTHSFKRATGMTPAAYRRARR